MGDKGVIQGFYEGYVETYGVYGLGFGVWGYYPYSGNQTENGKRHEHGGYLGVGKHSSYNEAMIYISL